ncbi:MAG: TerC family protein [Actinomycetota bacterium]|nr:TerC family protein [Actinomycetota bacterium]
MHLDPTVFLTVDGWITLLTLTFLEIVLGVDNLVFIAITSNRLAPEKQHIGRRLGLFGAMCMRICLLCLITAIMQLTKPLFTIPMIRMGGAPLAISTRDLILICGGAYLIFKGITELRDKLALTEERAQLDPRSHGLERIGLVQAVVTIMIMDIIFSLDSVITAAGVSGQLLIMIPAVIIAVCIMIAFADPISDFINRHAEMKILALTFIAMIGVLLITEGLHLELGIEILGMEVEKLVVYFAMIFAVILEAIQMRYNKNLKVFHAELLAEERLMHRMREDDLAESADAPEKGHMVPESRED